MDWLDLLAVQGTPKSLLQHHSSKASIFRRSAFFIVQLSHPYTTTGKTIALTRQTFVGKVMSLLFNIKENTHTQHIYIHTHNTHTHTHTHTHKGFPGGSSGKESTCIAGDLGSISGLGRSTGGGKGYPLQYSGLENSMDYPWGRKESNLTEQLSLHFKTA